jgi:DNA-binding NtrC family response regulator
MEIVFMARGLGDGSIMKKKILVIDDEPSMLEFLRDEFKRKNYEIITAKDYKSSYE